MSAGNNVPGDSMDLRRGVPGARRFEPQAAAREVSVDRPQDSPQPGFEFIPEGGCGRS